MFYYTHGNDDVESSAVYEVYFNQNDGELAIVLESGAVYQYSNATKRDFDELSEGTSPGTHYATKVKRNNGPGRSLGYITNTAAYFKSIPDMLAARKAEQTVTRDPAPVATVGTPKALTYAVDAKVTSPAETRTTLGFAEKAVEDKPLAVLSKHAVVFTVEGGNTRKTFNVEAKDVADAVNELSKATAALGLNVDVKEVTVYFE